MLRGEFVVWIGYGLIFLAAFIVARMVLAEQEAMAAQEQLDEGKDRESKNALVKYTRPFFGQYVVPMVRGKKAWDSRRKSYRRKLISAGLKRELTPDEFIAFKFFNILFFPIVGGVLKAGGFLDLPGYVIFGSAFAGWFYPDFWVNSLITKRHAEVIKALPFIVDLLALSTEAGLDFVGAIAKVVEKANPSPLVEELEQLLKEIKVGASRAEAMREMALRINMPQVNSFIAILISADAMGASIGPILRQQSEGIRSERSLRAEKAGAIASQKLILPVVIFILPAIMLMIFGPFILGFFYPEGST